MSPLSVSQFLDPDSTRFDLVIFDEACRFAPRMPLARCCAAPR